MSSDHLKQIQTRVPSLFRGLDSVYSVDSEIDGWAKELFFQGKGTLVDLHDVENYLRATNYLLNRLLALRREIGNLEAERLQTILTYQSTLSAADAECTIQIAKRPEINDAATAQKESVYSTIEMAEELHSQQGSPLNFHDRLAKLRFQIKLDFEEAFRRSETLESGINEIYGNAPKFPKWDSREYATFESASFLDDWVAWLRVAALRVESAQMLEGIHTVSVDLILPAWSGGHRVAPLILGIPGATNMDKARLKAIGITYPVSKPLENYSSLPTIRLVARNGTYLTVPHVRPNTEPIEWQTNQSLVNKNPLGFRWDVFIDQPTFSEPKISVYRFYFRLAMDRQDLLSTGMLRTALLVDSDSIPQATGGYRQIFRINQDGLELLRESTEGGDTVNNG